MNGEKTTAAEVREFLDAAEQQPDNMWWRTLKTLVAELFERLEQQEKLQANLRAAYKALASENHDIREVFKGALASAGVDAGAAPEAAEAPAPNAPPAQPGPLLGADGHPMSDAQAEAERMMEAAAGPHPMAQPGPPRSNGGGRRMPPQRRQQVAAPPPPMVGADGTPLDEAQAEAERMMEEAAGPR